jgi:Holliday junction resolvase RusA-like endonuclease
MGELILKSTVFGRPLVQKNNLKIYYRKNKMGSKSPFVGHSSDMSHVRDEITEQLYEEYSKKYSTPIDYPVEVRYVFYVPAQGEPDLDNLAAILLDAIQGKVVGKGKAKRREMAILVDDSLVLRQVEEKVVIRKADLEELGPLRTEVEIWSL